MGTLINAIEKIFGASSYYMQSHEHTAISTVLHLRKVREQFFDDVYSILKRTHLENFFHHINRFHQNIKFTMKEENNGKLLKRNNGKIPVDFCDWEIPKVYSDYTYLAVILIDLVL